MGRRKKSSSRSLSETENKPKSELNDETELRVLSSEHARYILNHPKILTEIFQDNTPGSTIFHQICKEGNADILSDLLDLSGTLTLETQDFESKYTALHDALSYGNINCAVKLIQHGASLATKACDGFSPLDIAVWNQFKNGFVPLSKNLNVLTWGANSNYNLGHNHDSSLKLPDKVRRFNRDTFISSIINVNFGKFHTLFLDKSGNVYSCGYGNGGRLGLGSDQTFLEPTRIPELRNVVKISCSNDHSLALTSDGRVYSWGVNTHRLLGHPEPDNLSKPTIIKSTYTFSRILTVKAAKYHSVLVASDEIYTFGFNGGQLGHLAGDEDYQVTPRSVTRLRHKPGDKSGKIAHVHASAAATVVGYEYGSIFICNQYDIKKIGSLNRFDILNFTPGHYQDSAVRTKKIRVTGGSLSKTVPSEHEPTSKKTKPLLITILDTNGLVFCSIPSLFKNVLLYHWDVYMEKFLVTDVALGSYTLYLLTTNGEVFSCDPYPTLKSEKEIRRDHSYKTWSAVSSKKKDSVQILRPIKLGKQVGLHNGTKLACSATGLVRACIVQDRISTLDFLPAVEKSTFTQDIFSLYDSDEIYETDLTVYCKSGKAIATHKALLASASDKLKNITLISEDNIELTGTDETVTGMLETVYMSREPPNNTKLSTLYNGLLDIIRCGQIHRHAILELSDVVLISSDGARFPCHRCVLAARVEYFMTHFMVNSRWGALNHNEEIQIDADKRTVSDFLYYIYTDTFPKDNSLKSLMYLLCLADLYLMSRLKSFCEVHLVSFITEENLIHVLRTANDYNAGKLGAVCVHVVAMNAPYYLEHRLLDHLEEEILRQLDVVYKEVVLFHLTRSYNKDSFSVMDYLNFLISEKAVDKPSEDVPKPKTPIKGMPDELEEYFSEGETESTEQERSTENSIVTADTPSTDTPSTDTPSNDTPSTDTPSTDTPSTGTPSTDTPSTDTPSTDTPSTDTPSTDTPSSDILFEEQVNSTNSGKRKGRKKGRNFGKTSLLSSPPAPEVTATPTPAPAVAPTPSTPSPTPSRPSWGTTTRSSPVLNRSLSEIIQEEQNEKKRAEIERKRRQSPVKSPGPGPAWGTSPQSPVKSPGPAWGTSPPQPSSSTKVWGSNNTLTNSPSFRDIMLHENAASAKQRSQKMKSPQQVGASHRLPPTKTPPHGSAETFDFGTDKTVHSLRAIMESEQIITNKTISLKSFSRPLEVIQIEERAIQELMVHYKVEEVSNEFITIRTVSGDDMVQPAWGKNTLYF